MGLYMVAALTACSGNHHDHHDHDHDHEAAEHPEHRAGEIVFSPEKAAAVGLETETIVAAPFEEAVKVSGRLATPTSRWWQR